jgi:O-antigen/teichoic acid export membrane protein
MSWMINTIAQVGASACMAIDRPQLMAAGSVIIILLNIVLSILLIKIFGFLGVAWGTMLSVNIGTIYFLFKLHTILSISVKKLVKITIPYLVICIFAATFIFGIDTIIHKFNLYTSRSALLAVFFVRGLVFFIIYLVGVYYAKLFDAVDIDFFRRRLPFASSLMERLFPVRCKTQV